MAEPAARDELSAGFLRRHQGQDPRRRPGAQQGCLSRAWRRSRWNEGHSRALDRDDRGRQILAQGDERAEGPRRRGHPDRRRRRPEGLSGGDRGGLSAGRGSNLHRPSHPQFAGFRVLERPEARRRRATENLPRRRRRGRPQGLGGLRGRLMGPQICGDRPDLAATMGADHPVLRLRSGRAQNRLHHECYRGLERQAATGRAGERPFPQRRGGDQAHFPGLAPGRSAMENAAPRMGRG